MTDYPGLSETVPVLSPKVLGKLGPEYLDMEQLWLHAEITLCLKMFMIGNETTPPTWQRQKSTLAK